MTQTLEAPPALPSATTYKCGTLYYTKGGLFAIFAWLLWGDFCFSLMEMVGPSVIPLNLKNLGCSDTVMALIMTALPNILNATVCPWVSYKSDRHRGPLGRRMPFIIYTLPFLTLALALVGFSGDLTPAVHKFIKPFYDASPATVTITLIGIFWVTFQFFNMFVGSVFYYLFNDVVPPQFLGRFTGLFRLVGSLAGTSYSFFIFQFAETNMREILAGGAILYCVGFIFMCFFVKEGKYPPPAPQKEVAGKRGKIADLVGFFRQSFSNKIYFYIFMTTTCMYMAGAMGMWGVFFSKEMGLTLKQMGQIGTIGGVAALVATYFTAVYVDRWHPLRIAAYLAIFAVFGNLGGWIWIPVTLPGKVFFWLSMGWALVFAFSGMLNGATFFPMCARIFPKSLYGQFSSAQAMVRSAGSILAGLAAGVVLDFVKGFCPPGNFVYRFIFIWPFLFSIGIAVFFYLAYREWRRLGGDEHYRPPASWLPGGFEEVSERVPFHPTKPKFVLLALWLGQSGAFLSVALTVIFIYMMHQKHMDYAAHWYIWTFMPLKILLVGVCQWQLISVRRDIKKTQAGIALRRGIPHHGVLMVFSIQGLVYFPIFWLQTVWTIEANMTREMILFGVANLVGMLGGIIAFEIVRFMERPVTLYRQQSQP